MELFKPGAYTQGTHVIDVNGIEWVADVNIKYATASPRDGAYWTKVDTSSTVNYVQSLIDKAANRSIVNIPSGNFDPCDTIRIRDKSLLIKGTEDSNINIIDGATGIIITGNSYYMPGRIEGINLMQQGENGMYGNKKGHGIEIHSLYDLRYINIKNFGENGVHTSGDVLDTIRSNASFNFYERVFVREIGGHGFYMQGGDASQILVLSCGTWDVSGYGFWDNSFLGCHFDATQAHASKLGHYRADNGGNRSTFKGCYAEQDSPLSVFGGLTRVYGGLHGWEVIDVRQQYATEPVYQHKENPEIPYSGKGGYILGPYAKADAY